MSPIKRIGIVALASAVFAAGAFVSGKAQAQDAPRGDAANGKRLYLAVGCAGRRLYRPGAEPCQHGVSF
jgi:hypothetical protein